MESRDLYEHVNRMGASDWRVRHQASAILFSQGKAALDVLIEGTSHANWRVRRGCADLMDHLTDNRCVEPLLRLLHDPIQAVRRLALHALGCQGCKACPLDVDIVDRTSPDG